MSDLTKQPCFLLRTRVTETARMPLRLTAVVAGFLFMVMPFLTGCAGEGETGGQPIVTVAPANGAGGTCTDDS